MNSLQRECHLFPLKRVSLGRHTFLKGVAQAPEVVVQLQFRTLGKLLDADGKSLERECTSPVSSNGA